MLIAFTGSIGAGTSSLSARVADLLGWPRVKFSDHIREVAAAQGSDPDDLTVQQALGQTLVRDRLEEFVEAVLARAEWRTGQNLVVDGLRHVEVRTEILRQIGNIPLHVVHVELPLSERAENRGIAPAELGQHDAELSEAQLKRILPQYANLSLDGARDHGELALRVIELFTVHGRNMVAVDEGEAIFQMMPLTIGQRPDRRQRPIELATELLARSAALGADIPLGLKDPLASVTRAMNSYYSNKIEGHVTMPIDIERALNHEFSQDLDKRNRQREAQAHIAVQTWLDAGHVPLDRVTEEAVLKQIHNQFFSHLPEDFHWVEDDKTQERWRVVPGEYRQRHIRVNRHVAVSPGAVGRFMAAFENGLRRLSKIERILAAASAHHRFLWIHPFLDGNGRVARMMSDAMLRAALDTNGIWSVTRGLARDEQRYRNLLTACDMKRRNDLDGAGGLSEEALVAFTNFFLETAIDQVDFMRVLIQPERMEARVKLLVQEEIQVSQLTPFAEQMALHLMLYGETSCQRLMTIAGDNFTAAEAALAHLANNTGIVRIEGLTARFDLPMRQLPRLLPGLFPE